MICGICGKNQATSHFTSIVNGNYKELWLCPECAKNKGIGQKRKRFQQEQAVTSQNKCHASRKVYRKTKKT